MEWNVENIDNIVQEINMRLVRGMTMTDIERTFFNVNQRVIHKRLERQGFKKVNNQYIRLVPSIGIAGRQDVIQDVRPVKLDNSQNVKLNDIFKSEDDLGKVIGLLDRYDEIITLLDMMSSSNKPNLDESIVLKLPLEEGKKNYKITIRINKCVWESFNIFCDKNKQYSKKDLVSQALLDYIKNHTK